jgi:hypothetical protein
MHILIYIHIHKQWGGRPDPTPEMYVEEPKLKKPRK